MALATLQGAVVPGVKPEFHLRLSHASVLSNSLPEERLFPQFILGTTRTYNILSSASAQDVFTWFRPAGPLVSVRAQVPVGRAHPTCILEYWDENHARYARVHCRVLHPALAALKPFDLQTYDPTALICTVSA